MKNARVTRRAVMKDWTNYGRFITPSAVICSGNSVSFRERRISMNNATEWVSLVPAAIGLMLTVKALTEARADRNAVPACPPPDQAESIERTRMIADWFVRREWLRLLELFLLIGMIIVALFPFDFQAIQDIRSTGLGIAAVLVGVNSGMSLRIRRGVLNLMHKREA
jgi:hypothetical protein